MFDGATGQALTAEEEARRKKAATSYDGNLPDGKTKGVPPAQNVDVNEQIKNIHAKFSSKQ